MEKVNFRKLMVQELKDNGLDLAEEMVEMLINVTFKVAEIAIRNSPTKWDDLALPILPISKNLLLSLVDKINSKDDIEPIKEEEKI